jgi:hypothetical protein
LFVQNNINNITNVTNNTNDSNKIIDVKDTKGTVGMEKQICRAWLKNSYLNIGKPCKLGDSCTRKHFIIIDNTNNMR